MNHHDFPDHRGYPPETVGISVTENIAGILGENQSRRNAIREWARMPRPVAEPCPSPSAPQGVHYWMLTPPEGENGEEWGTCLYCGKVALHRSKAPVAASTGRIPPSPALVAVRAALDAIPRGTVVLIDHGDTRCRHDEKRPGKYHCALYNVVVYANKKHLVAGKLSVVRHISPGWAEVRREQI